MKKLTPVLMILILCLCFCSPKKEENDLKRAYILGQVKTITIYNYSALDKNGEPQKDSLRYKGTSEYNAHGKLLEEKYISPEGNILNKHIYKYDCIGNLIELSLISRITQKLTYKNDSKGRLIETNIFDAHGSLTSKTTFKYDDRGNRIEQSQYAPDGRLTSRIAFKYESKGNMTESSYASDGRLTGKSSSHKDGMGNRITESLRYDYDGSISMKNTNKYDAKGRPIEWNGYSSDGRLTDKFTYKYDDKDNMIESSNFSLKRTYMYDKYDKTGNWLRQIIFVNDNLSEINEREIEYY